MKTSNPIINPYLFLLLKSLIRHTLTGSMHRNLQPKDRDTICEKHNTGVFGFSSNTLEKWFRDGEKKHIRLKMSSCDSLCTLLPSEYGIPDWRALEQLEHAHPLYSTGWTSASKGYRAFTDLPENTQTQLRQAVEERVRAIVGIETPTKMQHPTTNNALETAQERIKNAADWSAQYTTVAENMKRTEAWRLLHRTIEEQNITELYDVQRKLTEKEWQKIEYIIAIINDLFYQYKANKIDPVGLNEQVQTFLQVWHIKVFSRYINKPEQSYWQFVREMDTLAELYPSIGNVIFD